jgi:molecular chaperone GrpE (heat shock protein)
MTDAEAAEQRDFERCKRLVLDFCDWVAAEDVRLKADLRAMKRRHEREGEQALKAMIERIEKRER